MISLPFGLEDVCLAVRMLKRNFCVEANCGEVEIRETVRNGPRKDITVSTLLHPSVQDTTKEACGLLTCKKKLCVIRKCK